MSSISDLGSVADIATQYCRVLSNDGAESDKQKAWKLLEQQMAVVPKGDVFIAGNDADLYSSQESMFVEDMLFDVDSFYIDRYARDE